MATNVKAKKKKGTYDNKLILWISLGLAAFVAIVVGIFLIVTYSTNYVAKVDGLKIYNYEYNYFLRQAVSEDFTNNYEKPEGYDELSSEEQDKLFDEYFTDERLKVCQETALENARKFKGEYRIALENGCKLTSAERTNVKNNIDYYYQMYMSSYGLSEEMAAYYVTGGGMTIAEYKDFSVQQSTIEKYKNKLKEGYTATTEELRAVYDEKPEEYRSVNGRIFQFAVPTEPTVPVDDAGKALSEDSENTEDKERYQSYLTALEEYNAQIVNFRKFAGEMQQDLSDSGKYTLYNRDMTTYEIRKEKGEDGTEKEVVTVADADFETLCAYSAWDSASTNKGVVTVKKDASCGVEKIDEYLLKAQWNADRTGFTDGTNELSKTVPELIEVFDKEDSEKLVGLYLVLVEDITDFDTAAAEGAEDGLNTIQASIKSELLEDKAVAELEAKVEKAGSKYSVKSKKQKKMDAILKKVMA